MLRKDPRHTPHSASTRTNRNDLSYRERQGAHGRKRSHSTQAAVVRAMWRKMTSVVRSRRTTNLMGRLHMYSGGARCGCHWWWTASVTSETKPANLLCSAVKSRLFTDHRLADASKIIAAMMTLASKCW